MIVVLRSSDWRYCLRHGEVACLVLSWSRTRLVDWDSEMDCSVLKLLVLMYFLVNLIRVCI